MINNFYLFNNLPAAELLPYLINELNSLTILDDEKPWQLCWLNNNDRPVIGLVPKKTWTVCPNRNCQTSETPSLSRLQVLIGTRRLGAHNNQQSIQSQNPARLTDKVNNNLNLAIQYTTTEAVLSYDDWVNHLINYAKQHHVQATTCHCHSQSKCHSQTMKKRQSSNSSSCHNYTEGFMGFIGYDLAAAHISPNANIKAAKQPSAFLGHYDIYLSLGANQSWQLHWQTDTDPNIIQLIAHHLKIIDQKLIHQVTTNTLPPLHTPSLTLAPCWNQTQYQTAFDKVQNYLYQGDSYQINLTQKWQGGVFSDSMTASKRLSLINYLPSLYENTQAPFAGYLRIDPTDKEIMSEAKNKTSVFELLSCSPELFVVFDKDEAGNHHILTKPIKGTRPRGNTPQSDQQLKDELENSEKDRAENVMIVDLLRNDLGKYAKTGSVQVPKLFAIESFSNVHHMVSTVTATLKNDVHPLTVLFDSLPAGSITGAPKKRAIEIINELETGARGVYCGTMGFMNFDGTGQWNVLIRTLQATSNEERLEVDLWAGGGITVGSECEAEYRECYDKVGNLLDVLARH